MEKSIRAKIFSKLHRSVDSAGKELLKVQFVNAKK